ncbi:hypothetical protein RhiirA5_441142 [Rhizophagus irregularis]|uniref:Uncharacterized protein n=1 Tax=Rhizophagus irregularis TaxID=588596 RepID=A0A2I1FKU0_9GLOM|nr:hypothetical protein RhiirA5_441142 [Rhizophagus irregularis]PKY34994.1 hypothetical protein RhiirB3_455259 [Rhizophagus irregularis]
MPSKKKITLTDTQKYELCLYANTKLIAEGLGISENKLQFSNNWLQGFKKHNGICQQKLQGEAASG